MLTVLMVVILYLFALAFWYGVALLIYTGLGLLLPKMKRFVKIIIAVVIVFIILMVFSIFSLISQSNKATHKATHKAVHSVQKVSKEFVLSQEFLGGITIYRHKTFDVYLWYNEKKNTWVIIDQESHKKLLVMFSKRIS